MAIDDEAVPALVVVQRILTVKAARFVYDRTPGPMRDAADTALERWQLLVAHRLR